VSILLISATRPGSKKESISLSFGKRNSTKSNVSAIQQRDFKLASAINIVISIISDKLQVFALITTIDSNQEIFANLFLSSTSIPDAVLSFSSIKTSK